MLLSGEEVGVSPLCPVAGWVASRALCLLRGLCGSQRCPCSSPSPSRAGLWYCNSLWFISAQFAAFL